MYSRMMIMEANSEEQTAELIKRLTEHAERERLSADVMVDGDGRMVVFQTAHSNHDDLMIYSISRACRALMSETSYLLIGDHVIKIFKLASTHITADPPEMTFEIPF